MQLGTLTLNISFTIYLIWFTPQILLNFKRKSTEGLSFIMHSILSVGYLCDLLYGFGVNMPWQYRMVTLMGLGSLTIQHLQFSRYGFASRYYFIFSLFACLFIFYILLALIFNINQSSCMYAGMLANICWLTYAIPQIVRNYKGTSTLGLSPLFVVLALCLNICDLTSAWTLNWAYPSKIGPILSLCLNTILLYQILGYNKVYSGSSIQLQ